MHAEPARNWTLEELARIAGISRTVFAQRFKGLVGSTAMEYLSRWRMLQAADRLRAGKKTSRRSPTRWGMARKARSAPPSNG